MRQIVDANCWELMDGSNDTIKKINSFLTITFIGSFNLPSDECLKEAMAIAQSNKEYFEIKRILISSFYMNEEPGFFEEITKQIIKKYL